MISMNTKHPCTKSALNLTDYFIKMTSDDCCCWMSIGDFTSQIWTSYGSDAKYYTFIPNHFVSPVFLSSATMYDSPSWSPFTITLSFHRIGLEQ